MNSDDDAQPNPPKPPELVAVGSHAEALFNILREAFEVPNPYPLDLSAPVVSEDILFSPVGRAALIMRKLQALAYIAKAPTSRPSDEVLTLLSEVGRFLRLAQAGVVGGDVLARHRNFAAHLEAVNQATRAVITAIGGAGGDVLLFD